MPTTSVVLVGLANEEPGLQEYLGTLLYVEYGTNSSLILRYKDEIHRLIPSERLGGYTITINKWGGGAGLFLKLDPAEKINGPRFATGLNDSGTCGPIVFGAKEALELFQRFSASK
ncbi:MAG: hypothetical protein Q7T49_00460 [bacterium]|nr:hypothetical protein [bacterium]